MISIRQFLIAGAVLAAGAAPALAQPTVKTGLEVLLTDSMHLIAGKRVGLLTNHSGRLPDGTSTIDALFRAPGVKLAALFGPEHGIRGAAKAGERIESTVDSATGVPIYSLYGAQRVPTPEQFKTIDVLLYDIQDVGARIYTYQWTMAAAVEAAGKAGVPVVILDRPNPVRADKVDGGMLDTAFRSGVGLYPVPLRYGFTAGELARWLVGTGKFKAEVHVVPMQGYRRSMYYEQTGLPWVNPSPNLRNLDATLLYTGTVFFEGVNVSEGRGTDNPFAQVGASWLTDAGVIVKALNAKHIPGVWFDSILRPVEAGYEFGGQTIPMIRVTVTDRDRVVPVNVGAHMLREIYVRHTADWQWRKSSIDRLSGSARLREAVEKDGGIEALLPVFQAESESFLAEARKYWIYK
ncbi:MAG: DUF1343 domain-containing protein [Gemmatimonadaceae bacterium]|nr:DUF1343 domain-containing protein [Gemmatimonadaceae bacterium]